MNEFDARYEKFSTEMDKYTWPWVVMSVICVAISAPVLYKCSGSIAVPRPASEALSVVGPLVAWLLYWPVIALFVEHRLKRNEPEAEAVE